MTSLSVKLTKRHELRRGRRSRKTRYRRPPKHEWYRKGKHQPMPKHRRSGAGWLPPGLQHRIFTTLTWVKRLIKFAPIVAISTELVRFDTQAMQNPDIQGVEYQLRTLYGYEIREYVLEGWGRQCVYCEATNVPLQLDHIVPRSKNGSNRPSNLVPACQTCNQAA